MLFFLALGDWIRATEFDGFVCMEENLGLWGCHGPGRLQFLLNEVQCCALFFKFHASGDSYFWIIHLKRQKFQKH